MVSMVIYMGGVVGGQRLEVNISDVPIWNLADILITDNGSEISANTDG